MQKWIISLIVGFIVFLSLQYYHTKHIEGMETTPSASPIPPALPSPTVPPTTPPTTPPSNDNNSRGPDKERRHDHGRSHSFDSRGTGDGKGFYWNRSFYDDYWMPPPVIDGQPGYIEQEPEPEPYVVSSQKMRTSQSNLTVPVIPLGPVLVACGVFLLIVVVKKQSKI